jgi:replication-associated recombination protein RarA
MSTRKHDPWSDVETHHGLPADQVISALQKEIRRGNAENAVLLAYEMMLTSPAMEDYLWQRLMVISVEDVGFGEPDAPITLNALHQMLQSFDRDAGERKLFAVHAVRYLCACHKDRSNDEMLNWVKYAVERGEARATIPDYALDVHTAAGRAKGRGKRHFYEQGAKLSPELPGRDLTYRRRIMEMLDQQEKEEENQ